MPKTENTSRQLKPNQSTTNQPNPTRQLIYISVLSTNQHCEVYMYIRDVPDLALALAGPASIQPFPANPANFPLDFHM